MEFDVKSKEALAWVAGFFCGEGSISITRAYIGLVSMVQKDPKPLELVHKILAAYGVENPSPWYSERMGVFELTFSNTRGFEFLHLIMSYPMREKHRKRAEVYLKMFPPEKKGIHRRGERNDCYAEWLQLRITELQGYIGR